MNTVVRYTIAGVTSVSLAIGGGKLLMQADVRPFRLFRRGSRGAQRIGVRFRDIPAASAQSHLVIHLFRHFCRTFRVGFIAVSRYTMILIVVLMTSIGADAKDVASINPGNKKDLAELLRNIKAYGKKIGEELNEQVLGLRIDMDPVLRQIVCRVPYRGVEVTDLGRSLGISEIGIWKGAQELSRMGLVEIKNVDFFKMIVPKNNAAQEMMRRWAEKWCANDDSCGVQR